MREYEKESGEKNIMRKMIKKYGGAIIDLIGSRCAIS